MGATQLSGGNSGTCDGHHCRAERPHRAEANPTAGSYRPASRAASAPTITGGVAKAMAVRLMSHSILPNGTASPTERHHCGEAHAASRKSAQPTRLPRMMAKAIRAMGAIRYRLSRANSHNTAHVMRVMTSAVTR